jgi:hypothetical protein
MINIKTQSVKSINPPKSVIQTTYTIVKAHVGVPSRYLSGAIGMKVETKEGQGAEFIIQLPIV